MSSICARSARLARAGGRSIERDATVIADDATTAIGVRQAGNDADLAALHDLRRIGVENAIVVGFAVFREGLVDQRIGSKPAALSPVSTMRRPP